MNNSRLTEILKKLTVYEINSLEKFVNSPYFNSNMGVKELFKILKKSSPGFEGDSVDKKTVYKKLFGRKRYDDKKMRYLAYELLKLTEEFLGIEEYKKDRFFVELDRLNGVMNRSVKSSVNKITHRLDSELTPEKYNSSRLHYNKYLYTTKKWYLEMNLKEDPKKTFEVPDPGVPALMFFLVTLTGSANEISVNRSAYNVKRDNEIILKFLECFDFSAFAKAIAEKNKPESALIKLYHNMVNMAMNPDNKEYFEDTIAGLNGYISLMSSFDLKNLLTLLESYCIERSLKGETEYSKVRFQITKFMIENNAHKLAADKWLDHIRFHSTFLSAINVKEYEWAEDFINENSGFMKPEFREMTENICRAVLCYHTSRHDESLAFISRIKTNDVYFKMNIKDLQIRIFYERKQFDSVLDMVDSFKHFLARESSLTHQRKKNMSNFLNTVTRLVKISLSERENSVKDITALISEIENTYGIAYRSWLLEKAVELR